LKLAATYQPVVAATVAPAAPPVTPVSPVSKKMKPLEFLVEKCGNAIDLEDFKANFQVEEDDFNAEELATPVQWLVNLIDRNTEHIDVTQRPFHIIHNSNSHKSLLYIKKGNEWLECNDTEVGYVIRKILGMGINSSSRSIMKTYLKIKDQEVINATEYDKRTYIPEKDEDGEVKEKKWSDHKPTSRLLEELDEFKKIIFSLSNRTKDVLKSMKDRYTLQ
jgi:hypothetical protein